MRLEHHRAAGGQRRGGVAAGGGEGQREVAGAEHRHRADAGAVLAQVRARQRLALGQGAVDARAEEVATPQHLGEQAHLPAGTAALALDARGRQGGLAAHQLDEVVAEGVDLLGDGVEKLGAALRAEGAVGRVGCLGGAGGGVHLGLGGLVEGVGQRLAGAGVEAVQDGLAGGAAATGDEIVASDGGHCELLSGPVNG